MDSPINNIRTRNQTFDISKDIELLKAETPKEEYSNEISFTKSEKSFLNNNTIDVKVADKININSIGYKTESILNNKNIIDDLKKEKTKQDKIKSALSLFKQNNKHNNVIDGKFKVINNEINESSIINDIKKYLNNISGNVDTNVVNLLISNGISLEKIDLKTLSAAINEIKYKEKNDPSKEQIQKIVDESSDLFSNTNKTENGLIIKNLLANNLKISNKNVGLMQNTLAKIKNLNLNDSSIISLIENNEKLTLENIYKNSFSKNTFNKNNINNLDKKIIEFFKKEQIDNTKQNFENAKKLLANELSIKKENIEKYNFLENINENIDYDFVLNETAKNIRLDKNLGNIDLYNKTSFDTIIQMYVDAKNKLSKVNESSINTLIKNQTPITINNLINKNITASQTVYNSNSKEIKTQIDDIQKKLTYDAINRLSINSLNITNMPLKKAINILDNIKNINFATNLRLVNADDKNDNIEKLADIYGKIPNKETMSVSVNRSILLKEIDFSINDITKKQNILNTLSTFETTPNKKYGDSYKKVLDQIENRLIEMGISPTEENKKVYSILSKNNIDINDDNFKRQLLINKKIDYIDKNFTPTIIASMIKENIEPKDLHIDKIIEYIENFKKENGFSNETIEEEILKLDIEKRISKDDREKLINFYKGLKSIKKDNSVSLGIALKRDINLTFSNIIEASKYYNKTKDIEEINLNKKVNNILYENNLDTTKQNILNANEALKTNNPSNVLNTMLINDFNIKNIENINPLNIINNYNNSIENITTTQNFDTNIYQTKFIENINPFTVTWMQSVGLNPNLYNLEQNYNYIENRSMLSNSLNDIENIDNNIFFGGVVMDTGLGLLKEKISYDDILKNLSKSLDKFEEYKVDKEFAEKIKNTKILVNAQRKINISSKTSEISFPVKVNNSIRNLNIHLINDNIKNKKEINTFMSIDTKNYGDVEVFIKMEGNNVNLIVSSLNELYLKSMENNKDSFIKNLNEKGININEIKFETKAPLNHLKNEITKTQKKSSSNSILNDKYNVTI